ncbi:uncharacterized protein K452DRAFT_285485 [Aplosporella prunicola CBS 121167]|uniref:NCT transcriptional regulatory complex subunit A n=1 Tax=Aplosporella prunicola CBS 121167 TaxID=1176127 RepID=A0A6A6BKP6_9PEZI|nr:uncharacterized protein K452DRAFT_285485 [Aplosporella prunicola CBS 121167]KAF2144238.1 hypothetical protein K452DRAFT_285485 [Aplosporella prunicola CBS 121167]
MDEPDTSTYAPRSPDLSTLDAHAADPNQPVAHSHSQRYRGSDPASYAPLPSQHHQPFNPIDPHHNNNQTYHLYPSRNSVSISSPDQLFSMPRVAKTEHEDDQEWSPHAGHKKLKTTINPEQMDVDAPNGGGVVAEGPELAPGVAEGIEVKTKFPAARIKRIMQADEDVGKVAQVTPHVVAKALELFMISLVTKAANEAKNRSSKRVSAAHLKQAVLQDEHFDFLNDIVNKVSDAPAPVDRGGSPEETEGKKRKGAGRKKRKDSDDL